MKNLMILLAALSLFAACTPGITPAQACNDHGFRVPCK